MIEIMRIILLIVMLLTLIITSANGIFSTNPLTSSISFGTGGLILILGSILIAIGLPDEKIVDVENFLLFLCIIGKYLFRISGTILVFLGIVQLYRQWDNSKR